MIIAKVEIGEVGVCMGRLLNRMNFITGTITKRLKAFGKKPALKIGLLLQDADFLSRHNLQITRKGNHQRFTGHIHISRNFVPHLYII